MQQLRAATAARDEARASSLSCSDTPSSPAHCSATEFPALDTAHAAGEPVSQALATIAEKDAEIQRLSDSASEVARVRRAFDELAATHDEQMARCARRTFSLGARMFLHTHALMAD